MNKKLAVLVLLTGFMATGFSLADFVSAADAQKPKIAPPCKQCHMPDDKILRGALGSVSQKAETIQVQIGTATWLAKYDDNTKVVGAEQIAKIPKEKEIAVHYVEKDSALYATTVSVKQPAKVPAEKLIKVEEVTRLVAMGSEKGNFVLVDSRPGPRYHEGHIPRAILIYDAEFEKNVGKLPKEKDRLLIFYCAGVT